MQEHSHYMCMCNSLHMFYYNIDRFVFSIKTSCLFTLSIIKLVEVYQFIIFKLKMKHFCFVILKLYVKTNAFEYKT